MADKDESRGQIPASWDDKDKSRGQIPASWDDKSQSEKDKSSGLKEVWDYIKDAIRRGGEKIAEELKRLQEKIMKNEQDRRPQRADGSVQSDERQDMQEKNVKEQYNDIRDKSSRGQIPDETPRGQIPDETPRGQIPDERVAAAKARVLSQIAPYENPVRDGNNGGNVSSGVTAKAYNPRNVGR